MPRSSWLLLLFGGLISASLQASAKTPVIFDSNARSLLVADDNGGLLYTDYDWTSPNGFQLRHRDASGNVTTIAIPANDESKYPGGSRVLNFAASPDGTKFILSRCDSSYFNYNIQVGDLTTGQWQDVTNAFRIPGWGQQLQTPVRVWIDNAENIAVQDWYDNGTQVVAKQPNPNQDWQPYFHADNNTYSFDMGFGLNTYVNGVHLIVSNQLGLYGGEFYFVAYPQGSPGSASVYAMDLHTQYPNYPWDWVVRHDELAPLANLSVQGITPSGQFVHSTYGSSGGTDDVTFTTSVFTFSPTTLQDTLQVTATSTYYNQPTDPVKAGMSAWVGDIRVSDNGNSMAMASVYTGTGGMGTDPMTLNWGWVWNTTSGLAYLVDDPIQLLEQLSARVLALNAKAGTINALDAKVLTALTALEAANAAQRSDCLNNLNAFLNAVEAQAGHQISAADATDLEARANLIISLLQ